MKNSLKSITALHSELSTWHRWVILCLVDKYEDVYIQDVKTILGKTQSATAHFFKTMKAAGLVEIHFKQVWKYRVGKITIPKDARPVIERELHMLQEDQTIQKYYAKYEKMREAKELVSQLHDLH